MTKLTVKEIEAARHGLQKERLCDGGGLFLRLYPSGLKLFQVQVAKGPDERGRVWVTLGPYPDLGLKRARDLAGTVRLWSGEGLTVGEIRARLIAPRGGAGPAASPLRRRAKRMAPIPKMATPFRAVAKVWFDRKCLGLKNGKHIGQNWATLATYVFPSLGDKPIGAIITLDVVEALRPIWHAKHETARRTLGRVAEVFDLAQLEYGVPNNPARFAVTVAFGKVRRRTQHFGSIEPERMPEFWEWLQTARCPADSRHLLGLLALTAKRSRETRFAEWRFFSSDFSVWTTPAELMKMSRTHRVPVSRQARVLLDNMRLLNGHQPHVFARPRNRSGVICENVACKLAKGFDPELTAHGLRAAFKTWARQQRIYRDDAVELALAHEKNGLESAYQRADLLEERAELMQDWADYVTGGRDPQRFPGAEEIEAT